jgi:hypothetical protein
MRTLLPIRYSLLLVLAASMALARSPEDKVVIRTLTVSQHPGDATNNIYVSGKVATVLRFEQDVDPANTRLLGWEGRFEPLLVGSKKVVIEPLRDLGRDEGVPLLVTLADGTALPFLVRPPWSKGDSGWTPWTDHQVNVFLSTESYEHIRSSLYDSIKREGELSDENERLKKEENSTDHAFATLLAHGEVEKTPFRRKRVFRSRNEDMDMIVEVFKGPGKAAAVVTLKNTYYGDTWKFDGAYLTRDLTHYTAQPFALRMNRALIEPGQSGKIAVVADKSAFEKDGQLVDLALQIFRGDGLLQVFVKLEHTLVRQ